MLREQRGWTLDEAADAFGLSRGGYIKVENGERGLKAERIVQAAEIYEVSQQEVVSGNRQVPVVGYVAAGEAIFNELLGGDPDTIEAPLGCPPETVAVRIRGDSLGPGFDRWYALYADRRDPMTDDLIGELCIVGTSDDRTLVKWVRAGRKGFNLVSGTGNIEEGVEISWAAKVLHLTPG